MLAILGYMRFNFSDNIRIRASILLVLVELGACSSLLLGKDSLCSLVHHCFLYLRHNKEHITSFLPPKTAKYSERENTKTQDQVNSISCLGFLTWTHPVGWL